MALLKVAVSGSQATLYHIYYIYIYVYDIKVAQSLNYTVEPPHNERFFINIYSLFNDISKTSLKRTNLKMF